jgi:hypothetical protein
VNAPATLDAVETVVLDEPGLILVMPVEAVPYFIVAGTPLDRHDETCQRVLTDLDARSSRVIDAPLELSQAIDELQEVDQ